MFDVCWHNLPINTFLNTFNTCLIAQFEKRNVLIDFVQLYGLIGWISFFYQVVVQLCVIILVDTYCT